jgi:hypothetical protein
VRIILIVLGIVIGGFGVATVLGKFQYTQEKQVLQIGSFTAKADQQEAVPQWLGIAGIVVGLGLLAGGALKKS